MTDLGCTNGNCYFRPNTGQVTNAGCTCVRAQEVYTQEAGWAIPVQRVQIMVAKAVQVAVQKERAQALKERGG